MTERTMTSGECWAGPWDGRLLTVNEGTRVIAVPYHSGEYLWLRKANERGELVLSEWVWRRR